MFVDCAAMFCRWVPFILFDVVHGILLIIFVHDSSLVTFAIIDAAAIHKHFASPLITGSHILMCLGIGGSALRTEPSDLIASAWP